MFQKVELKKGSSAIAEEGKKEEGEEVKEGENAEEGETQADDESAEKT